ncbi:hypothetical protein LAZ67_5004362 [Cordylochernes scorpioides]|uniref:Endonuclease/exonuclease/phosphatase domain-containing protein n=1 Tax=Cordylochernes scorpioides TaxID=51811 RepID=A0ABY6KLJ0_9ARAC|nr:hypothetical protein LAZ67_5004362 [Cordylochernes scorpioides]
MEKRYQDHDNHGDKFHVSRRLRGPLPRLQNRHCARNDHRGVRPRLLQCSQLQIIAALACGESAWILGDLNISDESAKDLASGSTESLAELLDQADLFDVATFFDAALEHTRVATIGSRVDARRLDRILLPSGFCGRVAQYQTIDYAYSDHCAVLIQVGDPSIMAIIAAAIHPLPNGRSSGGNGLPFEFVKAFEDFFAEVLCQVFEASRSCGALTPSSRRSKVILLPKLLSGVLMGRLHSHLTYPIPECQTYVVKGRSSS